jgi:flagellar hook-associated protein 3 FlgL
MRITTANAFDSGIENLTRRQSELTETQNRLTSGKRVNKASDDPAAAARAERALASISRAETSQRSVEASRSVISLTESALGDAGELLQQAREALVAAGNGAYSDSERRVLGDRISGIREQLLAVANRSDGASSYLFGGQGAMQPPFIDAPGGVQFRGTGGQLQGEPATALPLSSDGSTMWLEARTGNGVFVTSAAAGVTNAWIHSGTVSDPTALFAAPESTYSIDFASPTTYSITRTPVAPPSVPTVEVAAATYTEGQAIEIDGMSFTISGTPATGDQFALAPSTSDLSVFSALDKAVRDLSMTNQTGAQKAQANADNLRNLDAVLGNLLSARAMAGDVLNRIDSETDRLGAQKLSGQIERSNAEDLDLVQAVSEFQNQQTGYDAALKSYSMVQRMSLFQYING